MNCDEAFEHLTDPARRERESLQWHLDMCPRCRQMRDVLEPALDLFLPPDDDLDLGSQTAFDKPERKTNPSIGEFAGRPSPESVRLARTAAAGLPLIAHAEQFRKPVVRRIAVASRYAAAALAGAALTLSLISTGLFDADKGGSSDASAVSAACAWMERSSDASVKRPATLAQSCVACHIDGGVN